jgi:hypothetical protein
MQRNVLVWLGATLIVAACGGPDSGSMLQSELKTAVIDEPDGRVSLYSGHLIADALARGDDLESLSFMTAFLRLRVPRSLLDTVPPSPGEPVFISLEQAYPGVEILVHDRDVTLVNGQATRMQNSLFLPADPWLTGNAQVVHAPNGAWVGGAYIVKYTGTLPMGSAEITWGSTSCTGQPGCPSLRYDNPDPCRWPLPVPASWTLHPLQEDGPQTLDALCDPPAMNSQAF